jgi:hypothetical protein
MYVKIRLAMFGLQPLAMKDQIHVVLVAACLLLSACVTQPPRSVLTESGRPEVVIATADVAKIKSVIVGRLLNQGYTVESDNAYSLTLVRAATGMENFAAAMSLGNAYSTNAATATFTFVRDGEATRVVLTIGMRAQMPGGQVRQAETGRSNAEFNTLQHELERLKRLVEQA